MWQRIQTVFMALVIISLLVSFILPIWKFENNVLTAFYFLQETNYQYFPYVLTAVLGVAACTVSFIQIRSFKNRLLQMKLGALNSLFLTCTIGSAFYFSNSMMKTFQAGQFGLGLWMPGAAVVFNLLANQFIRRDEKLVRDSDRIR